MKMFAVRPIGVIRSEIKNREDAPLFYTDGAPNVLLEILPAYAKGLHGMQAGDEIIVITWLHRAHRDVLKVHPRGDVSKPLTGAGFEYGGQSLVIGAADIALSDGGAAIKGGSDRVTTFSGSESFTIPPGALAISDPVELSLPPLSSVAVSLFLPNVTSTTTMHWDGRQTAYMAAGNKVGEADLKPDSTTESRLFLSRILVNAPANARAIVTFGDSITDGDGSSLDANHRWPDLLAERLQRNGTPIAVLNEGISGARVLADRMGANALARFDEDVLTHPKADTVILMMGINDIGWPESVLDPNAPAPSAEDIINGYEQLIARAHDHGLRIIGATLTPFGVAFKGTPLEGYYGADKEAKRAALNEWIRNSGAFDGVIDFDAVVRDPAHPTRMLPTYDKGDNLHPNDAGYQAMAESIDLKMLTAQP